MSTTDIADQARQADMEAIKQVVATVEHSQNNELPDEFVALFRADAIWTTGGGKRLFGREAISTFTHQVLPGGMGVRRSRSRSSMCCSSVPTSPP